MANEIDSIMEAVTAIIKDKVPELNVYPFVVPGITVPAAMANPPDEVTYGETFDDDGTILFVVRLYVTQRQDGGDQRRINQYISRDDPKSVVKAIQENPTLNDTVADAQVVQAVNYGNWPVGSTTYTGVELRIKAMLP